MFRLRLRTRSWFWLPFTLSHFLPETQTQPQAAFVATPMLSLPESEFNESPEDETLSSLLNDSEHVDRLSDTDSDSIAEGAPSDSESKHAQALTQSPTGLLPSSLRPPADPVAEDAAFRLLLCGP